MSQQFKPAAIPRPPTVDRALVPFTSAVKQNLDMLTGQLPNSEPLAPLDRSATIDEIVASVNRIIRRMGA
jgi:hypothetical protein